MKFNKKQKSAMLVGLFVIAAALIIWISLGGEIFTKTQILIEKRDEILGTTYKEWKDQFVLGLDYTMGFVAVVFAFTGLVVFMKRDKKRLTENI